MKDLIGIIMKPLTVLSYLIYRLFNVVGFALLRLFYFFIDPEIWGEEGSDIKDDKWYFLKHAILMLFKMAGIMVFLVIAYAATYLLVVLSDRGLLKPVFLGIVLIVAAMTLIIRYDRKRKESN